MKRLLFALLALTLCITVAACGSVEQTPTTVPQSTSTTSQGTTTSATATTLTTTASTTEAATMTTVTTVAATTTTSSKTGTTKRTYEKTLVTTLPTFANGEVGDLFAKLPWTAPPHVPFYGETPSKLHLPLTKVIFSNRDYSLVGGASYSLCTLFFDDGSQHDGSELENLLTEGKVSIDDVVALFGVTPNTNAATDVATGEERFGEMISYRRSREATVKQGHAEVHIYPPFDFIGEFFTDDRRSDSVGYYVNAAYLNQIIQAACPSVGTLDTAEAIRVGDSLFVPLSAAEKLGITVNVGERNEESPSNTPSLQIVLPNA